MAKKTLWQRLNEDVRLGDIVTPKNEGRGGSVQDRVDRIWQEAAREAQRRGVSVQTVLRELGFDVADAGAQAAGSQSHNDHSKRKLLQTLNWDEVAPAEDDLLANSAAIAPVTPWPFDDVLPSDVAAALGATEDLAARVSVLTGSAASAIKQLLTSLDGQNDPWHTLLRAGLPADAIESAVRSLPFFPPHLSEGLGDRLLLSEALTFKQYHEAQRAAQSRGVLVFAELVQQGVLTESRFIETLAEVSGLAFVDGEPGLAADEYVDTFPAEWARAFHVVPVALESGGAVGCAFVPPAMVKERVRQALGAEPEFVLIEPSTAARLAEEFAESRAHRPRELPEASGSTSPAPQRRSLVGDYTILQSAVRAKSAVALVRMLFEGAIQANATDIHLERYGENGRVRYRIDGVLHPVMDIDTTLYDEVIARVKILADMDITERRRPQDGHLHLKLGGRTYDLRIASVPTKRGEKIAIRLASTGRIEISLDSLGLLDEDLGKLRDIITRPYGIVLASGPVGSGKTTTLYAALNEFDRDQTNVATIEDPVEIELEGANQVEVNYTLGMDFAAGLRALLRQDPDTLLIGEIRDEETANIAARAGMTGRMVFSTLHANDSVGAITTLRNFGLPAHLVASALQGVVAQRLMRRLCDECKEKERAGNSDRAMFKDHGIELPKPFSPYGPVGCDTCFGSGYAGRLGVFEVLRVDRDIRQMIIEEKPEREIRTFALERGLRSLQEDAVAKISNGLTTIEEYRRVLRF